MLAYRLLGLVLAAGGAAVLLFISYALYTHTETAPHILVNIGMPATFLMTLLGAFTVGLGVWLAGFAPPAHGPRHAPPGTTR